MKPKSKVLESKITDSALRKAARERVLTAPDGSKILSAPKSTKCGAKCKKCIAETPGEDSRLIEVRDLVLLKTDFEACLKTINLLIEKYPQ